MFSIVLTPDEIAYLSHKLKLKPDEHSPVKDMTQTDLSDSDKKKIEKALKKGNVIVTDSETKKDRINVIATAALGIVASPKSMIDILVISGDRQDRRSFFSHKDTWLGFSKDKEAYILTTPVTDEMIRDFVFMHLTADQLSEQEVVLAGDELILASVIFDLYRAAKQSDKFSFSLKDIQNNLMNNKKRSVDFYKEAYGPITEENIEKQLQAFTDGGYLKKQKDSYSLQGELLTIAQVLKEQKSMMITRYDRETKGQDIRTLTLLQGKNKLILQQTILAQTPVVVFKEIDKDYAAMVVSIATRSASSFAAEYKKLFDQMNDLNQNSQRVEQAVKKATEKKEQEEKKAKEKKAEKKEKPTEEAKQAQAEEDKPDKPTPLPQPEPSKTNEAELEENAGKDSDSQQPEEEEKSVAQPTALPKPEPQAKEEKDAGTDSGPHQSKTEQTKTQEASSSIQCPSCKAELPAGAKFCNKCGHKIEAQNQCPNCHKELPPDAKFCRHCGQKI